MTRQFRIIKSLSELPPRRIKTFNLGTSFIRDFAQLDKAIVNDITLIIAGTGVILFDDSDPIEITNDTRQFVNIDLQSISVTGQTSGYAIIAYLELSELEKANALKVN